MAFGEPRLDRADDISAVISHAKQRIAIVAARQRVNLTEQDEAELVNLLNDIDLIHRLVLELRSTVSANYLKRIGKG
jgi:uncharacterized protein (DUF1778 family)